MDIGGRAIEVKDVNREAMDAARARQDNLTKPPGSLGVLEEISIRVCGIKGEITASLGEGVVVICAADHGVTEEGVSAYPSEVTGQMLLNFASGGAAINVLARHAGARVVLVDVGTAAEVGHPGISSRKIRKGTANFARGPAMSVAEAEKALLTGMDLAEEEIEKGAGVVATGEMGIGNTTASSALTSALTGIPVRAVVGRGTGVDDAGLERKVEVIERSLALNKPSADDPVGALAKVGGLEIGALAGAMLGAAMRGVPTVIDGFISGAAALLATRICPQALDYLFASHLSTEPGHRVVLEELGLAPFLHLDMRLGEGTGAVLGIWIMEAAVRLLSGMATFDEAGVSRESEKSEIQK